MSARSRKWDAEESARTEHPSRVAVCPKDHTRLSKRRKITWWALAGVLTVYHCPECGYTYPYVPPEEAS